MRRILFAVLAGVSAGDHAFASGILRDSALAHAGLSTSTGRGERRAREHIGMRRARPGMQRFGGRRGTDRGPRLGCAVRYLSRARHDRLACVSDRRLHPAALPGQPGRGGRQCRGAQRRTHAADRA
ncbi:hypothetical protein [Lysobacter gummosus]|uniref:hypothetical protein n=1 Tax=Lysobacter gummosus TaxID=262324 RepID=UPI003643F5E2